MYMMKNNKIVGTDKHNYNLYDSNWDYEGSEAMTFKEAVNCKRESVSLMDVYRKTGGNMRKGV